MNCSYEQPSWYLFFHTSIEIGSLSPGKKFPFPSRFLFPTKQPQLLMAALFTSETVLITWFPQSH
jgi:hypothetical protein